MKVRTEARREAILQVALQAFLQLGFERTSMAEIASRVGGSKATLYGYFPSKEELFLAVCLAAGERHMAQGTAELASAYRDDNVEALLSGFGQKMVAFLFSDRAMAAHRMVLAESARSDIATRFYERGPRRGIQEVAAILKRAMDSGRLRQEDPAVAASHFIALICAEHESRWFQAAPKPLTKAEIKRSVERATTVFLRGYAPVPASGTP